jgi:hypothetical protein
MRSSFLGSVLVVVATSGAIACTGTVEDGANAPALEPRTDTGTTPATEPANDPGDENEGEDPFFETPFADAGAEPDSAPADSGADAPPAKPATQLLAEEASRELKVMKVTAYEHTTFVDEPTGTFKYDCSGFLGYALSRVLPTHFAGVKSFNGVTRPLAKHYETFFESIVAGSNKSGWTRVARAIDLRPGDVVAWLKPADLVSTNTGHVMIVRGTPTLNPKRSDEVLVPITDSTSSFHGPTDSRSPAGEGLGTGPIGIIVDSKGAPIRYRWTGGYSTKEYSTAIAFGRPE